ncbi:MAG: Flp family type IVb pilin [Terriglobales bacterium]
MWKLLTNLKHDESGQDLIEYALIAALIALGAVTSMKSVSTAIGAEFTKIATALS